LLAFGSLGQFWFGLICCIFDVDGAGWRYDLFVVNGRKGGCIRDEYGRRGTRYWIFYFVVLVALLRGG